jgi:hypothetical protein
MTRVDTGTGELPVNGGLKWLGAFSSSAFFCFGSGYPLQVRRKTFTHFLTGLFTAIRQPFDGFSFLIFGIDAAFFASANIQICMLPTDILKFGTHTKNWYFW